MDEPTDGLDPNQKYELRKLISQLKEDRTILVSTHILEEVEAICTRAIILSEGKIVGDGTPEELLSKSIYHNAINLKIIVKSNQNVQQILLEITSVEKVKSVTNKDYNVRRSEFVGPVVGDELKTAGMLAVSLALLSIMVYIWFRFEWQFSIAAIIALTHDVLTTVGLFSILQLEFNLATIAAILTTAGYSINDTVVIFDRVRENLRRYKSKDHYFCLLYTSDAADE